MMIDQLNSVLHTPPATSEGVTRARAAPAARAADAGENDFATLISQAVADVAGKLRKAEAVSVAGIKGTASTQDVVEQVMAAEQALQTTIVVRDKIVAAYLEISRMSI